MGTMKQFFKYLIAFILLFIFVSITSYWAVINTYKTIQYEVITKSPSITLQEVKATSINGYLKGNVKNNTLAKIDTLNIRADFYGKTGAYLGSEYLALGSFSHDEEKEFRLNFRYNGVESCKVNLNETEIPHKELTQEEITMVRHQLLFFTLVTLILLT